MAVRAARGLARPITKEDSRPLRWLRRRVATFSVLFFLLGWEAAYSSGLVNPLFLSSPSRILSLAYRLLENGVLLSHLAATMGHFVTGFACAALLGITTGLVFGWYRLLGDAFEPFLTAMISAPRIVLLPLITLWVGIGFLSRALIVFLSGYFPVAIITMSGVRSLDPNLLRVARAFGATPLQTFRTVALPASLPHVVSGLRVAMGQSLVTVVAAEMFVSTGGVGYFVARASANFNVDQVFVGISVVVLLGLAINVSLAWVEGRLGRWRSL